MSHTNGWAISPATLRRLAFQGLVLWAVFLAGAGAAQDLSLTLWEEASAASWQPVYPPSSELVPLDQPPYAEETSYRRLPDLGYSDWCWHFRPKGFVYSTYWASAAEPRLATHTVKQLGGHWLQDSHIGGRVGIVRYGPRDRTEGWQLDVLAGAKLRQDWDEELDVVGTDYRYDILTTYAAGSFGFKFGFYHVSSHAGDEFLLKNPGFDRLNYFRDALVLGISHYPAPPLRLYAEVGWAFAYDISQPWEFQFGIDYGPAYATGITGAPFAAINAHLREELDFGGNLAFQLGWAWRGEWSDGVLRAGMYYYNGYSPQFSFYAQHEQQVGLGLWYDY